MDDTMITDGPGNETRKCVKNSGRMRLTPYECIDRRNLSAAGKAPERARNNRLNTLGADSVIATTDQCVSLEATVSVGADLAPAAGEAATVRMTESRENNTSVRLARVGRMSIEWGFFLTHKGVGK